MEPAQLYCALGDAPETTISHFPDTDVSSRYERRVRLPVRFPNYVDLQVTQTPAACARALVESYLERPGPPADLGEEDLHTEIQALCEEHPELRIYAMRLAPDCAQVRHALRIGQLVACVVPVRQGQRESGSMLYSDDAPIVGQMAIVLSGFCQSKAEFYFASPFRDFGRRGGGCVSDMYFAAHASDVCIIARDEKDLSRSSVSKLPQFFD